MCEKCTRAVQKYFPDCPEREYGSFLFAATSFPFGDPDYIEQQLKEAINAGCKNWHEAVIYAHQEHLREMEESQTPDKA
jgi:hypothetical protein